MNMKEDRNNQTILHNNALVFDTLLLAILTISGAKKQAIQVWRHAFIFTAHTHSSTCLAFLHQWMQIRLYQVWRCKQLDYNRASKHG